MSEPKVFDIYGHFQDVVLHITQFPRRAVIDCRINSVQHYFRFDDPQPLEALTNIFDDCWEIRVIDRNREENNFLEFGRYRVEFWSEDDLLKSFVADRFEICPDDAHCDNA